MKNPNTVIGTLVYIRRTNGENQEIVLAKVVTKPKTVERGLAGKRNSYGGGLETCDNSIAHCGTREVFEESGVILEPESLKKIAVVTYRNPWGDYECHYFVADENNADPRATDSMLDPQWFSVEELPLNQMMESDSRLLPILLAKDPTKRKLLAGEIWHDKSMSIIRDTVIEVQNL